MLDFDDWFTNTLYNPIQSSLIWFNPIQSNLIWFNLIQSNAKYSDIRFPVLVNL